MSPRHISFHFTITQNPSSSIQRLGFILPDRSLEQLLKMSQTTCINLPFPHTLHFKVFRQQQKTIKGNSELRLKRTICFQAEGHKTSVSHCRDYILPLSGIERLQNNVISINNHTSFLAHNPLFLIVSQRYFHRSQIPLSHKTAERVPEVIYSSTYIPVRPCITPDIC